MDASPSVMSMARFDGVLSVLDFLSTVLSRHLSKEQNGLLILVNLDVAYIMASFWRCLLEGLELLLFPRSLSQPDSAAVAGFLPQRQLRQFHPLIVFVVAPQVNLEMKLGFQVLSYANSDSFLSLRGSHSHTAGDVAIVLPFNSFLYTLLLL